jgi:hypothetical protein
MAAILIFGSRSTSDNVDSVISGSGMATHMGLESRSIGTVQKLFPLPVYWSPFCIPVISQRRAMPEMSETCPAWSQRLPLESCHQFVAFKQLSLPLAMLTVSYPGRAWSKL